MLHLDVSGSVHNHKSSSFWGKNGAICLTHENNRFCPVADNWREMDVRIVHTRRFIWYLHCLWVYKLFEIVLKHTERAHRHMNVHHVAYEKRMNRIGAKAKPANRQRWTIKKTNRRVDVDRNRRTREARKSRRRRIKLSVFVIHHFYGGAFAGGQDNTTSASSNINARSNGV